MQATIHPNSGALLRLTIHELAIINDALSARIFAHKAQTDAELCNELEKQTFKLYCELTEK